MGIFDIFKKADIQQGIDEYQNTAGAVLLDVRTPGEYKGGRIPGSKNVPLQSIEDIADVAADKATPLFVYCQSGARSSQAVSKLKAMGYTNVKNLGGINAYRGRREV